MRVQASPFTLIYPMRRLGALSLSLCALVSLSVAGCDDDERASEGVTLSSCAEAWEPHYLKRVPTGSTRWLPALRGGEGCPVGLKWVADEAPEGAALLVEASEEDGEQSEARVTPLSPGAYTFFAEDESGARLEGELSLEVVDALERPFHNYNYYPSSRAAVRVGDELWVAGVSSPQVARIQVSDGAAREPILVGGWPVGLAYAETQGLALVTHKADDTLGLIDAETGVLVDAIWVGDEPSEVLWDEGRERAYVSLSGAGQVAVVDVPKRRLIETLDAVFDAQAMAMSPDGATLVVASRRSGQTGQLPYADRPLEEERDLALIDLERLELEGHVLEVASTIHALRFDEEGSLWVSATSNNTEGSLNDPEARSFVHELFTLSLASGEARRGVEVDLSRQDSSGGSTGVTGGFTWCAGSLWVAAEGANAALELDDSLAELRRVELEGRPRVVTCVEGAPWVISSNHQTLSRVGEGEVKVSPLGLRELRDSKLIDGFDLFHGQGEGVGDNRSCSACHADGLSDGVVWNAGPVENRQVTRPLRWLEGTEMIGWDGYVGSVRISGYVGGSTINVRGDTQRSDAMGAYLASLMPAPAATSLTRRDGALSELAAQGEALFTGDSGCSGCHTGAVSTSRAVLPEGLTPGKTDIPTLIDVARVGSWYKTGEMPTLAATLDDTAEKFEVSLSEDEREALLRYLRELTARDFFTLKADLGPSSAAVAVDATFTLTMSYPVLNSPENLSLISLTDSNGEVVDAEVIAEGRHVLITPAAPLGFDSEHLLEVAEGFMSDDGRAHVTEGRSHPFTTASAPSLRMEGRYTFTAQLPFFNPQEGIFDPERSLPSVQEITATPSASGATWAVDYGAGMVYTDEVVLSADELFTKALPISAGPSFLNGQPLEATTIRDEDGDGVIDLIEGTMTLTGPGLEYEGRGFSLTAKPSTVDCVEGTEGSAPPSVTQEGGEVIIDWGSELSLSLFVTSPEAQLPLGPVAVMGGETYWALAPVQFPNGFAGPVTYGVAPEGAMDASATHDAPEGGARLESGKCYKFGVLINFMYSTRTILWP